jgi:uncharacterized protein (TIGR00251 family)
MRRADKSKQPPARPAATSLAGLALRAAGDGTLLPVRVTPRGSRNSVEGVVDGVLRVRLTAPPVEGAANAALVAVLAERLDLPKSGIALVGGATGRIKTLLVRDLTPDEILARLGAR